MGGGSLGALKPRSSGVGKRWDTVDDEPKPLGFPRCGHCALRPLDRPEVCIACRTASTGAAEARTTGRGCPVCGQGLVGAGPCPNRWCGRADRAFSVVFAVGRYDQALRGALHSYKFRDQRWWAGVFARLLAGELARHANWFEEFDVIVGMPAYCGPGARRTWDHVRVILAELDRQTGGGWDLQPDALGKVAETPRLSGRTRWDRERIAQGYLRPALELRLPAVVDGARVLVVDDVFTEGSSLHEVARLLRRGGAQEVAGLVLGRPEWEGKAWLRA
jgi:ComF family protein